MFRCFHRRTCLYISWHFNALDDFAVDQYNIEAIIIGDPSIISGGNSLLQTCVDINSSASNYYKTVV